VVADFEVALVVGIAVVGITIAAVGSSVSVGVATVIVLASLVMASNELLVPLGVASVVGGGSISITIGVLVLVLVLVLALVLSSLVLSLVLGGLVVLTSLVVRLSLVSRDNNNKYKVTHLSDFNATKDRQSTCWESSSCHQSL
jgi:hypothetical protein